MSWCINGDGRDELERISETDEVESLGPGWIIEKRISDYEWTIDCGNWVEKTKEDRISGRRGRP